MGLRYGRRMDLAGYAARIGYGGPLRADLETLRALHLAHATHIPFENVDVLLGRTPELDVESLERKLVDARRGGYCYEQNTLFAAVLEECGFRVTRLAARVRWGAPAGVLRPRTHMLLAVEVEGETHVADVGFGGDGLLLPIPLRPGEAAQFAWQYRIVVEERDAGRRSGDLPHKDLYVLQSIRPAGWLDLYGFTLEPQDPVDYQVANWYTSTHPKSVFRNMLRVQLPGPETRLTLVNRTLTETTVAGSRDTDVGDDAGLLEVLGERFGLRFPEGTRIPFAEVTTAK
jgi:N-hydroxyarylamine O-acetyltransferase